MVDFFNALYSCVNKKNKFFEKIRLNTLIRVAIRLLANIFIPIYFKLVLKKFEPLSKFSLSNKSERIIVSLTTFPDRIERVWLVIMCIFNQKIKPDLIVLWLSKKQFSDEDSLPSSLLKLKKYGLEIVFCDNDLKSHKKYYYALEKFPNDIIITVDDDVFYHSELISKLIIVNKLYPRDVCSNHAVFLNLDSDKNLLPYIEWKNVECETFHRNDIMPVGIGGVLYPPKALYKDVLNINLIKELCFSADDIWLNAMSRINGTKVSKTNYDQLFLPIINFSKRELTRINVTNGLNDRQIGLVRDYYFKNIKLNPFQD